jgi:hypothetical protein
MTESTRWKKYESKTQAALPEELANKNRFARKQSSVEKKATSDDGKPLSPNQRWARASKPVEKTIGWEQHNAKTTVPQRTNGGLVEDDSVKNARQAMLDAGEAPGYSKQVRASAVADVDPQTKRDLVVGMVRRTPDFKATIWNCTQLEAALTHFARTGKIFWTAGDIDRVYQYLREEGHLEGIPGQHGAPREFVPLEMQNEIQKREQERKDLRAGKASIKTIKTPDQVASETEARKMDFNELRAKVRGGYRKS